MVINPIIVGVYIPIIRIPIKGGMTIPNIATFDPGTYGEIASQRTVRFMLVKGIFLEAYSVTCGSHFYIHGSRAGCLIEKMLQDSKGIIFQPFYDERFFPINRVYFNMLEVSK